MKIKSRRGVYYDFSKSPYEIELKGITFKFSSQLHLSKFIDKVEEEIERTNDGLAKFYNDKYPVMTDQFALIRLYNQIEKRDFYLVINGWVIRCLKDLEFVLSVKNAHRRLETSISV